MRLFPIGVILVSLSGCASFDPGGAQNAGAGAAYHYAKTADGCEITITSVREFPAGFQADVGSDCEVSVSTESVTGSALFGKLVDKIPSPGN